MKRNQLEQLLRDLKKLHETLGNVIERLDKTLGENPSDKSDETKSKPRFTDEELRAGWQRLREEIIGASEIEARVNEYLADKSKAELSAFIRVNELPIAAKDSKEKIARQLAQLLRVGATVRGK